METDRALMNNKIIMIVHKLQMFYKDVIDNPDVFNSKYKQRVRQVLDGEGIRETVRDALKEYINNNMVYLKQHAQSGNEPEYLAAADRMWHKFSK
jgi:predicted RNA binding protein with dsRBD fold (UPF0201 family)